MSRNVQIEEVDDDNVEVEEGKDTNDVDEGKLPNITPLLLHCCHN
jgi:hypothetical protein